MATTINVKRTVKHLCWSDIVILLNLSLTLSPRLSIHMTCLSIPEVSSLAHPVGNPSHVACAVEIHIKKLLGVILWFVILDYKMICLILPEYHWIIDCDCFDKVSLLGLCVRIRMTLMAIRATADSDLAQEQAASGQTGTWIWH